MSYGNFNELRFFGDESYQYDESGNIISKELDGKITTYQIDPMGRICRINLPDESTIGFAYDIEGRRLTKQAKSKDGKCKTFTYFYIGDYELGCVNENGKIVELRIPADPNCPEESPILALELNNEPFVVLEDLSGNVKCLLSTQEDMILEHYEYSAFGEEEIFDEDGDRIEASQYKNPWRYQGQRVDEELGLVYFGKRFYDPKLGRWLTPDPLGYVDGPNRYCYVHNNPFKYVDRFGTNSEALSGDSEFQNYFYGEVEPHCVCEEHRNCKRGGDSKKSFAHGFIEVIQSNRFQGAMQAFGGAAEFGLGGAASLSSGGSLAVVGWPVMAHGTDQFTSGMYTLITGESRYTATEMVLQRVGMSPDVAATVNDGVSIIASMGAGSVAKMGKVAAAPVF
ncbi:MAG: RHS repeat-associated core domain-containing protein [Rhabdochlamydiaceae bacterium]|nr:RHS repeat-associated core domain-containing protein [Candidatus Amphrikana amoebophyrae]